MIRKLIVLCARLVRRSRFGDRASTLSDYHARREKLAAKLDGGVALLFAPPESGDEIYGYRADNNFYYLTGWPEPGGAS